MEPKTLRCDSYTPVIFCQWTLTTVYLSLCSTYSILQDNLTKFLLGVSMQQILMIFCHITVALLVFLWQIRNFIIIKVTDINFCLTGPQ